MSKEEFETSLDQLLEQFLDICKGRRENFFSSCVMPADHCSKLLPVLQAIMQRSKGIKYLCMHYTMHQETGCHDIYQRFTQFMLDANNDINQFVAMPLPNIPFERELYDLTICCAQLWWFTQALRCKSARVVLWAKEGTKIFHNVFKAAQPTLWATITQLNACDLLDGMLKLEGFEKRLKERFQDNKNFGEALRHVCKEMMWQVLEKTFPSNLIVPRYHQSSFYAIHVPCWDKGTRPVRIVKIGRSLRLTEARRSRPIQNRRCRRPITNYCRLFRKKRAARRLFPILRASGLIEIIKAPHNVPITKWFSKEETCVLEKGLKNCRFIIIPRPNWYDGSKLQFHALGRWLAEEFAKISSSCKLLFISFSLHGFQSHLRDAFRYEPTQKFVEFINSFLGDTPKVLAIQSCRHVPPGCRDEQSMQALNQISLELERAVKEQTRNMVVMMAAKIGELYHVDHPRNSYLSRIGYGMQRATTANNPTMYNLHFLANDACVVRANERIYYTKDIFLPVPNIPSILQSPAEN